MINIIFRRKKEDTMKRLTRTARAFVLVMLLCMLLTTTVFAAEDGNVWLKLNDASNGRGVATLIVTDTTVTDGVVTLTYDSSELTYKSVEVTDAYVAMYSVNAEEKGVVRISWVAPEAYKADGSVLELIQVNFTGKADEDSVELSGTAFGPQGDNVNISDKVEDNLSDQNSANTGDASMVMLASMMALASAAGIAVLYAMTKRGYAR